MMTVMTSVPVVSFEQALVFEGSAATGSTYEIFEQIAIGLPESSSLGHLRQVVHTELEAELFQVLDDKVRKTRENHDSHKQVVKHTQLVGSNSDHHEKVYI